MELKEIAVVSGKPGLYKIIKPAVNGVILEAMDGSKARLIVGTSTKVSVLGEISVYTENGDNIPLIDVFRIVFAKYGTKVELDPKQTDAGLRSFFTELVPEHDKQRVYNSDIKKIVTWYNLLVSNGFDTTFAIKSEEGKPEVADSEHKKEKKAVSKKETSDESPVKETPKAEAKGAPAKKVLKEQDASEKTAGTEATPEKKAAKPAAKKAAK